MELIRRDDALHIVDVAEDEHPYKVPGLFVTYSEYNQGWSDAVDFIQSRIGKSPTIDAVPVVRCGECKHLSEFGFCMNPTHSIFPLSKRSADWFCADGERREE